MPGYDPVIIIINNFTCFHKKIELNVFNLWAGMHYSFSIFNLIQPVRLLNSILFKIGVYDVLEYDDKFIEFLSA